MQRLFLSNTKFFKLHGTCECIFYFLPVISCCRNFCSVFCKTHYDILGIDKTCKNREIRSAYLKLCKKFHPDAKPGCVDQHKKFLELNKAYTILINPESRKMYDNSLSNPSSVKDAFMKQNVWKSPEGFNSTHWKHETHWYEEAKYYNQFHETSSAKGISKVWIVCGCFTLMLIGSFLYYFAYSFNKHYISRKADEKSREIILQCNYAEQAEIFEKEAQIKYFKQRRKIVDEMPSEE